MPMPGPGYENDPTKADDAGTRNSRASNAGPESARGPNAGSRPDFETGEDRVQTDDAQGHEARSFQTPPGVDSAADAADDDPPEDHYDPLPEEVTRGRMQGLGVGARDLQLQRDPQRPAAPPDEESRPDGE